MHSAICVFSESPLTPDLIQESVFIDVGRIMILEILAIQVLRLSASTAEGAGSTPGWGTNILHANRKKKKEKRKKKPNTVLSSEHSYSGSCASLNVLKSEFRVDVSVSYLLWGNTSAQYSSLWEVEYDDLCGLLR